MENQATEKKKVILSGIQPSGILTLGNYIGAIRNWTKLQNDYDSLFMVADMHSITVRQDPALLRKRCLEVAAIYLACGIDPEKSLIFCQSHVPQHAQLSWVLNCYTYMGELSRMTQFKDKSAKHADNINAGLFTYPVLMASDILIYQSDLVPVGVDQKQHLELARDIAIRFNNTYSPTFVVPEGYIPKTGAKIMSLQDPTRKMSKSDPEDCYVAILDEPDVIRRKLKRAVTDSLANVHYDPENQPGVSNLLTIYSVLRGIDIENAENDFTGKGYGDLKNAVADAIVDTLSPVQAECKRILADKAYLESVLLTSAERASRIAQKTVDKVYRKVGFAPKKL